MSSDVVSPTDTELKRADSPQQDRAAAIVKDDTNAPRRRKQTTFENAGIAGNDLNRPSARPRSASKDSKGPNNVGFLRRMTSHLKEVAKPEKKIGTGPGFGQSVRAVATASWLNLLLVFIPVSWALHFATKNDTVIFVTAFLAIIPLAKLLAFSTEELSIRVGQTLGGLLNATLGNAVEVIVSIIALFKCELTVVQSSLVGSILSNLLLVLGMCFFAGGTKFAEQGFMQMAAQLNSSLLILSVVAVLLPAAFHVAISSGNIVDDHQGQDILQLSHGVAVILLISYIAYLVFTLWSHAHIYSSTDPNTANAAVPSTHYPEGMLHRKGHHHKEDQTGTTTTTATSNSNTSSTFVDPEAGIPERKEDEEVEEPTISVWVAVLTLIFVTVLVAVTAEFLVSSIDGLTASGHISKTWVGLILLPIVGNAAEHVTAVTVSVKDKLDLSIGVAVGSSIQISLLVIPLVVVVAWCAGKPLTLLFDPFQSVVLFLSVLTVTYVINDGKSNWLEGAILMNLYIIIAISFWFYPGSDPTDGLNLLCHT